ncbi:hypothetical protein LCGC14_1981230 [marine sediment metagenome]|uniref:Uncharacterized protein n=1 Tax=marine sediment metagenome TaxID=412755 RepID=A0A0F9I5W8_9ZZZZ
MISLQKYQQIGFIIALVIAGVSLPTSIISLTREPTIINDYFNDAYYNQTYYNQTYNYYNTTTIINNNTTIIDAEDDYSRPLEVFLNIEIPTFFSSKKYEILIHLF